VPPIPGLGQAEFLTSENLFDLRELPPRLTVLGGGPGGCELGQAFARLGSRVEMVEAAPAAGESIAALVALIRWGGTVAELSQTIHAYPTYSEGPAPRRRAVVEPPLPEPPRSAPAAAVAGDAARARPSPRQAITRLPSFEIDRLLAHGAVRDTPACGELAELAQVLRGERCSGRVNPMLRRAGPRSVIGLVRGMRDTRDHRWSQRRMSDYIDGELPPRQQRRLEAHAQLCPDCGRLRRSLTVLAWELRELGRARPLGTTVASGVIERLRTASV
jgi:hypothetical protein